MNTWNFTGNLGRDAETKFVGESSVTEFSVAVKSGYGDKESTAWPRCQMWGTRGEKVAQYLVKGQLVGVSGELSMREYDKKDGSGKGYSLDVRVNDLTLLGKKGDVHPQDAAPASEHSAAKANAFADYEDDIPF